MKSKKLYSLAAGMALCACLAMPLTVYAGTINAAEAGILSAAKGTFEYNGQSYQISPGCISQLEGYLSQDGIDLTESQANEVAAAIYGNISVGVAQGYFVPIGGSSGDDSEPQSGSSSVGEPGAGKSTDDGTPESKSFLDVLTGGQVYADDSKEKGGSGQPKSSGASGGSNNLREKEPAGKDALQSQKKECKVKKTANQVVVYDKEGNTVIQSDPIIKSTGYGRSFRLGTFFAVLFVLFPFAGVWTAMKMRHLDSGVFDARMEEQEGGCHGA